jgi:hypothetical protein
VTARCGESVTPEGRVNREFSALTVDVPAAETRDGAAPQLLLDGNLLLTDD